MIATGLGIATHAAAVTLLLWLGLGGKRDVLETYETKLRVIGALVFVACLGGAGTGMALHLLLATGVSATSCLLLPLVFFFLSPLAAAVWAYLRIPGYCRKHYRSGDNAESSIPEPVLALVTELSVCLMSSQERCLRPGWEMM